MRCVDAEFVKRFRVDREIAVRAVEITPRRSLLRRAGTFALGAGLVGQVASCTTPRSPDDAVADGPREAPVARARFTCPAGMVAIRGGEFTMGDGPDSASDRRHRARVSPLCLDATEVTVARFREFWSAGHPSPAGGVMYPRGDAVPWAGPVAEPIIRTAYSRCNWGREPGERESHPINCVDWFTMQAYCAWRGGRLPTEAEWEFAARGVFVQTYPWGNDAPAEALLNAPFLRGRWPANTAPVGSFPITRPPGVFFVGDRDGGLYDMAGNVREWVADGPADYPLDAPTVPVDPVVAEGSYRALRGSSWEDSGAFAMRAAFRNRRGATNRGWDVGGRCARTP